VLEMNAAYRTDRHHVHTLMPQKALEVRVTRATVLCPKSACLVRISRKGGNQFDSLHRLQGLRMKIRNDASPDDSYSVFDLGHNWVWLLRSDRKGTEYPVVHFILIFLIILTRFGNLI